MRVKVAGVLVTVWLAGCGGGSTPTSPSRPDPAPAALSITCPASVAATTTGTTAQVAYQAPSASGGQLPVSVACTPASGSSFPLGTTPVSCTATDVLNRQSTCSFSVSVTRLPSLQRTSFLAFGDSITAGEVTVPATTALEADGLPSFKLIVVPTASYPTQLQAALRTRYVTQQTAIAVANAGVPGENTSAGAVRFPGVMSQVRPEVVLLLEGYNDLNSLGTNGVNQAAANLEQMARDARLRGARVYLANLTPPRAGGRNTIPVAAITALNDRLRLIATAQDAVLVDLYQALVSNVALYVGVDGLHPTEAGYQRMAETFLAAIQGTLENR